MKTIFADEMNKKRLMVSIVRMLLTNSGGKNIVRKINVGHDARNIRRNSENPDYQETMKDLRRVRTADPSATQPYQPRQQQPRQQQHMHTSLWHWRSSYSITNHGVMINGSHRLALIGKSTNSKSMEQPVAFFLFVSIILSRCEERRSLGTPASVGFSFTTKLCSLEN